jgi:hypothetical protein
MSNLTFKSCVAWLTDQSSRVNVVPVLIAVDTKMKFLMPV